MVLCSTQAYKQVCTCASLTDLRGTAATTDASLSIAERQDTMVAADRWKRIPRSLQLLETWGITKWLRLLLLLLLGIW